ncbi:hypothetical protein LGN04_29775 [Burkholderia multivorans]|uniref:hypothetical protein n=1 Tax=Burkholderia multivorans TaxID=87883 RepID=UPI0021BF28BD|nr:hypothetical protein [Burkholderia multivorans]MCA8458089.1 hypothetical protein [Burkholderia multivorans]MDR8751364.1 hypothetical protein [Burkholderia multivorans]MDR8810406.1 hypothetical protein [Burkholderia multivorans]
MPTMWFAKDGPRPNSQSGPGVPITFDEAEEIIGSRQAIFAGVEAPSINADRPSHAIKNVVLEVEPDEGASSHLSETGFYVIAGISPSEAERLLESHRNNS